MELGFDVEIWDWASKDVTSLAATGASFSSMTGYLRGTLADSEGAEELMRTAELSLEVAERLDCPRLNLHGTGLDERGLPFTVEWQGWPARIIQHEMDHLEGALYVDRMISRSLASDAELARLSGLPVHEVLQDLVEPAGHPAATFAPSPPLDPSASRNAS